MKTLKILLIFLALSSCNLSDSLDCYDGKTVTKTISIAEFHKLDIDFSCTVFLKEGNQLEVKIEGKEDLISELESLSKVENDTWKARLRDRCFVLERSETKLFLTVPNLAAIFADGNVNISTDKSLTTTTKDFSCAVDGNADLTLDLKNSESIILTIDGNADVNLIGKGKTMTLDIDGNADLKAHDFAIDECSLLIDGNASADVKVNTLLKVIIDGVGRVCYKGNPTIDSKVNGVGTIKNCN